MTKEKMANTKALFRFVRKMDIVQTCYYRYMESINSNNN